MTEIYDQAENKWEQIKDLAKNPKQTLTNVGLSLVDKAIDKVEKEIRSKVDKKSAP